LKSQFEVHLDVLDSVLLLADWGLEPLLMFKESMSAITLLDMASMTVKSITTFFCAGLYCL